MPARPPSESLRVAVQARPLLPFETLDGAARTLTLQPSPPSVRVARPAARDELFDAFDAVYDATPGERPDDLYDAHVSPLVSGLFGGFNATVFAYGQTSAGKSYTMAHVTRRVAEELFARKMALEAAGAVNVTVRVGFVEIYRENIRDLVDGARAALGTVSVQVRERRAKGATKGGVYLDGARERCVHEQDELMAIIREGALVRQTAATGMNASSSRSHSVITITVQQEAVPDAQPKPPCLAAKLHLVDLAGSERAKRTAVVGARFAEGVDINKGLFALAKVISALADNAAAKGPKAHVPYRDSKLTRLLQDSLGGNARTLLVACISPADTSREETLGTLRYAARAKCIKNRPRVNTEANSVEISDLRASLARSRAEIAALATENERLRTQAENCICRRHTRCSDWNSASNDSSDSSGNTTEVSSERRMTDDKGAPERGDALIVMRDDEVVDGLKFRIAQLEGLLQRAKLSEREQAALLTPDSDGVVSQSPLGKLRNVGLAALSHVDGTRGPRRRARPPKPEWVEPHEEEEEMVRTGSCKQLPARAEASSPKTRRTISAHALPARKARRGRVLPPAPLTLGHSAAAMFREKEEGSAGEEVDAHVASLLSVNRLDEMRRTFTERLSQTEADKATLDKERMQLKRKLGALQKRHEKELDDVRATHQARVAAMRTKMADVKRLEGECVRLRKLRDGDEKTKRTLLRKVAAAEAARQEMAARLSESMSRMDAVKKEFGKENRELMRSERSLKAQVQKAETGVLRQEAVVNRLKVENEGMKRKLRGGRQPAKRSNTQIDASNGTTPCYPSKGSAF